MAPRIGLGTDLHRLEPGNGFRLGGVKIECKLVCVAHSDGDVLLHAITDAVLGALGAGDIGDVFPDSAAENRDRDSADFLGAVIARMGQAGYRLGNLDATVSLETPKLSAYKDAMVLRLASLCECEPAAVNVKAKTGEGVGPVGRSEALSAQVAVLLLPL